MISQPELGNRIIELRRTKGLTQEELIDKCNISVRTLQRIEAGEVTPRNSTIRLIFEALEISDSPDPYMPLYKIRTALLNIPARKNPTSICQ